jgi:hypothetical protein
VKGSTDHASAMPIYRVAECCNRSDDGMKRYALASDLYLLVNVRDMGMIDVMAALQTFTQLL